MSEARGPDGRFPNGVSGNPGGRPKKLVELERVLDEHRTADSLREVFARLRWLAVYGNAQAIKIYLDRVIGPVKVIAEELPDLSGAPDEVLAWLANNL